MSKGDETRRRVLDAARGLLEAGEIDVSMGAIAEAAGVTRQLLYHHFEGRADLLLELSRVIDTEVRTAQLQAKIDNAASAVDALRAAIDVQGAIKPRIDGITAAMDRLRATDADIAAAWDERESARLARCQQVVQRLADEGSLTDEWSVDEASQLLWSMTSQQAWRQHVEYGWSTRRWITTTTRLARRALLG